MGGAIDVAAEDRANALLRDASAAVRRYTGQVFTYVEDDPIRLKVGRMGLRLPERPVHEVASITTAGGLALAEGTTWVFDGIDLVAVSSNVWAGLYWPVSAPPNMVDVIYTHGYEEIPDDVVAVVCNVAARAFGAPAEEGAVSQETLGPYSYSRGAIGASGPVGLFNDEKHILDVYRRSAGSFLFR